MGAVGSRIGGRFRLTAVLGRGGMATVYRAVDEATGNEVALKRLEHPANASERTRERGRLRFRREFHTHVALRHPHIVSVRDFGYEDDDPYYTMELLTGSDLRHLGKIDHRRACALVRDVAAALAMLHAKQLVHRDVTLGNVRCTDDGRAKVIDLGVVASVGASGEVAGTPPFIAPETARALPIDHRADLFGLGVVAYFLLTGVLPFRASSIAQLEDAWREKPPPPSRIAEEVPPALDELVLSMLSLDPLARPTSAAEVIDRLGAIAELDGSPDLEVVHGYLASASLVGRQREMRVFGRRLAEAKESKGGVLHVEAPSGTGKSRLLTEMALEAQMQGALVVEAIGDEGRRGTYGVVAALLDRLRERAPDDVDRAVRARAAELARVLPDLVARSGAATELQPAGDPRELRLRAQDAVRDIMLDLTADRVLTLIVDDAQRCDEASAAALATLAHVAREARLLLVIGRRSDESAEAPVALDRLRATSRRLRLRGLDLADTETLLRTLFGAVPNVSRLADRVHQVAEGNPLYTTELVRQLVDRRVIRYLDGVWALPEELPDAPLPSGLAGTLSAAIDRLSAPGIALGEVLAIHGGEIPLERVLRMAEVGDEERVFSALDELVGEGVLLGGAERYRFRHDGIREAFVRRQHDARREALHRRVGESLASEGEVTPKQEATIGWHLLKGGDRERGGALLSRAGARLFESGSHHDCIAPLEAALLVLDEIAAGQRERASLRWMLLIAGCMSDRRVALAYARIVPYELSRVAGLEDARRLARWFGPRLGLALGFACAWVRWLFTSPRERLLPATALTRFFSAVTYAAAAYTACFDAPRIDAMIELARPVEVLGGIPRGCVALMRALRASITTCREEELDAYCEIAITAAQRDRRTPATEQERAMLEGGARFIRAVSLVVLRDPRPAMREIEALGLRFFDIASLQVRTCWHRWRGEVDEAEGCQAQAERLFVQLGSMWQMESVTPVISTYAYGFSQDVAGLRKTIDRLERLVEAGYALGDVLDVARAEHARLRGDLQKAYAIVVALLDRLAPDDEVLRMAALPILADVAADGAEAPEVAQETVSRAMERARRTGSPTALRRCEIALARLESGRGDRDAAAARLDAVIADAERSLITSSIGLAHEARALLAHSTRDRVRFEYHATAARRCFETTHNPVLVGRLERLTWTSDPLAPAAAALASGSEEATTCVSKPRSAGSDDRAASIEPPARLARRD